MSMCYWTNNFYYFQELYRIFLRPTGNRKYIQRKHAEFFMLTADSVLKSQSSFQAKRVILALLNKI
jgi:hypothetical protein